MNLQRSISMLAGLAVAAGLAGCASAPEAPAAAPSAAPAAELPAPEWRKILQQEERFAVYVSQPAVREGDLAHFRMVYVYMPEEVFLEGREVAWQEYSHVTIDCPGDKVRMGPRTRYAPGGAAFGADNNQEFAWIIGGAVVRSKDVYCNNKPWEGMVVVPGGDGWIERERAKIPGSKPL
ncbi:MAG: hypothetical protein ACK4MQ_04900 [Hyphomonas sp.]